MSKRGVQAYAFEMKAHTHKMKNQLDVFHAINAQKELSDIEYYALERVLQISIESAIGLAKHWAKLKNTHSPADAKGAFDLIRSYDGISLSELTIWNKIVGMRNALVHDYLVVDKTKVLSVLSESQYLTIFQFTERAIAELLKD